MAIYDPRLKGTYASRAFCTRYATEADAQAAHDFHKHWSRPTTLQRKVERDGDKWNAVLQGKREVKFLFSSQYT